MVRRIICMHKYIHYMIDFVVEISMEKSWIYLNNHLCDEYWDDLLAFIED